MRVAIRFIYNKAAAPSCHIVDMTDETWIQFIEGDTKEIACKLLGIESEISKIKIVCWMPIDGLEEILQSSPAKTVNRLFDKSTLRMYLQPFLEMNTSLSCNQISRIINMVKERYGLSRREHPTVKELTSMTEEEVVNYKRISKINLIILKDALYSYGLSFKS